MKTNVKKVIMVLLLCSPGVSATGCIDDELVGKENENSSDGHPDTGGKDDVLDRDTQTDTGTREQACSSDTGCPHGYVCEPTNATDCGDETSKRCVEGCRVREDCDAGQICDNVLCDTCPCPGLCRDDEPDPCETQDPATCEANGCKAFEAHAVGDFSPCPNKEPELAFCLDNDHCTLLTPVPMVVTTAAGEAWYLPEGCDYPFPDNWTVEEVDAAEVTACWGNLKCEKDTQCPHGYVCEPTQDTSCDETSKRCVEGCRVREDCDAGQICDNALCETCPCPGICRDDEPDPCETQDPATCEANGCKAFEAHAVGDFSPCPNKEPELAFCLDNDHCTLAFPVPMIVTTATGEAWYLPEGCDYPFPDNWTVEEVDAAEVTACWGNLKCEKDAQCPHGYVCETTNSFDCSDETSLRCVFGCHVTEDCGATDTYCAPMFCDTCPCPGRCEGIGA